MTGFSRVIGWTSLVSFVLVLSVASASAQLTPAPGFTSTVLGTQTRTTPFLYGLEYDPVTDRWLTIDPAGFDSIVGITRSGVFSNLASGFGLGGLTEDDLTVAGNGQVWVTESHARSAYTLTPSKQVVATLPGDPNGPSGPEDAVAEADANGRYNPKLWIGSVKKAAYPFA